MVTWSTLLFAVCRKRNSKYVSYIYIYLFILHGYITNSIGSLSNDDGNGNENVTRKYIFILFVLLRDNFNSLNFYKNGELSRNQIGRSGVQVKEENEKFTVVRSRSPQNLICGHFTLLFCRGWQRNVQNVKPTCRAIVLLIKPIVLRRCCCRRRRRCLSSLI